MPVDLFVAYFKEKLKRAFVCITQEIFYKFISKMGATFLDTQEIQKAK